MPKKTKDGDIIDIDLGYKDRLTILTSLDGAELKIGIHKRTRRVNIYAAVHEVDKGWMTKAVDGLEPKQKQMLDNIQRQIIITGDVEGALDAFGDTYALAMRQKIVDLGLVDTGHMRDSVETKRKFKKTPYRN